MRSHVFLRLVCALAAGELACPSASAEVRDVELKAAYIYNFAQFTVWPETGKARDPFLVCASPASVLWTSLQALNGKLVNNRPWNAVDAASQRAANCDLLVLSRSAERPAAANGVLVVRDGSGRGGAITLVEGDQQIRFDVDTSEASRSGLRFSSKLLRLARNVL